MKGTHATLLILLVAAAAIPLAWISTQGETGSRLHVVPLGEDLLRSGPRDLRVFVLSAEEVLVEARPSASERLDLPGAIHLGSRGPLPLWLAPTRIPGEFLALSAEDGGVEVVHSGDGYVIFRATYEIAYELDELGYVVSRIDFIPISRLAATPDAGPVHERLLEARPVTEARLDFMRAMSESASADSLRDLIYFLSYDSVVGEYRSRFAARYDLDRDITPALYQKLREYMEPVGGQVQTAGFDLELSERYQGQADRGTNVWGEMLGKRTSAYYIICGHFDATASRDAGFDTSWADSAAPGADDNATGAAGVIECARLIAPMSLDFGVVFALFSAEENLGKGRLQGSKAFVESLAATDSIIGVINIDMVGYMEDYRKAEISYGWRSEWLSSSLEATAESLHLQTGFEGFQRPYVQNSDHASFWLVGIPALMFSERNEDGTPFPIYPDYHSAADTLGNVDMDQVRDNVALVVGYMSRFADIPGDSLSDLDVTQASIEFDWDGRSIDDPLVAGDDLTLSVRALNIGGPMGGSRTYDFKVWQGEGKTGPLVHESQVEIDIVSGGTALASATWKTSSGFYGEMTFTASLLPVAEDVESDITNNEASGTVTVSPQNTVLENLHIYPNPTGDPGQATIAGDIYTSQTAFLAGYVVEVFDVTGLRLLRGEGQTDEQELAIPLSSLTGNASSLAPGLYICTLRMNIRDEAADISATTKFAVVSGSR